MMPTRNCMRHRSGDCELATDCRKPEGSDLTKEEGSIVEWTDEYKERKTLLILPEQRILPKVRVRNPHAEGFGVAFLWRMQVRVESARAGKASRVHAQQPQLPMYLLIMVWVRQVVCLKMLYVAISSSPLVLATISSTSKPPFSSSFHLSLNLSRNRTSYRNIL